MLNNNVIPDAINCSKSLTFTQIPNDLIRNPKISAKAKTILCILLSNTIGWKSYITTITEMMKEGKDAIQAGISELEEFGYVKRIKYRDKKTKQLKGSFWAYCDIPFQLYWEKQIQILNDSGMELIESNINEKTTLPKKPRIENQVVVSRSWKPANKNINKNINIISFSRNKKNTKERENISRVGEHQTSSKEKNIIPPPLKLIEEYCQERNSSIDPQTFYNWNTSKGWMIGKNKMKDWQAAIRTWELKNKQDSSKLKLNNNGFRNTSQKYREPDFIVDNTKTYNNG
jgi:hypothetical protein